MNTAFIGIDPGKSGSTVILTDGAALIFEHSKTTPVELSSEMRAIAFNADPVAYIEEVHAMPGNGAAGMFRFGESYGSLWMMLVSHEIPFERVRPQKWQREFGLIKPKMTKTQKKNLHKTRAQELFPGEKITHSTADALLIAEYCRRHWKR